MKTINDAYRTLTDLKHELDLSRNSLGDKFELVGDFIDQNLEDVADQIDKAIDRIEELEAELAEANEKIEELESEKA